MNKRYQSLLLSLLGILLLSSLFITPINAAVTESGNITNPTAEPYISQTILTTTFLDMSTRVPNWTSTHYYWVQYDGTNFVINLYSKSDSVIKFYSNYTTPNSYQIYKTTSSSFSQYHYNRLTGAFLASFTYTLTFNNSCNNQTLFSNIPVYTQVGDGSFVLKGYNRFIPAELTPGGQANGTDYGWWGNLFDSLAGWIVNPLVNFWNGMGFGTFFTNLGNQIGTFFTPIATDIGNSMAGLFIPTQQDLTDFFNDFNTFFNSKLGFVWYPINWTISTFNSMLSVGEKSSFPLGTLFGGQLTVDLRTIEVNIPSLWSYMRLTIQFITSWTLVSALYQKLMSKLKGDNSGDN